MISLYYNFWDYWQLYHKVTFDGANRLILINPGETQIDIQRDVYSAWKEWSLLETNTKYLQALNTVGGEPTIAGQFLDVTYFLINGWRIKPYPGSYSLNLVGNLFEVDGNPISVSADRIANQENNININTNTSVIVRRLDIESDAVGGLTPEQNDALFDIEGRVVNIESILNNTNDNPLTVTLEQSQEDTLLDIQAKLIELWRIHGLDRDNPMAVSKQGRLVADIEQIFTDDTDTGIVTVTRDV